jgi:hypothetical protein
MLAEKMYVPDWLGVSCDCVFSRNIKVLRGTYHAVPKKVGVAYELGIEKNGPVAWVMDFGKNEVWRFTRKRLRRLGICRALCDLLHVAP